jgi:regulator of sigma E protease
MSVLIAIVAFVIILVVLVVAHEFAHFITAKVRGVQIIEFGVGFPPRIWGIKRGETIYSINALPLGGFVKLAGEENPEIPRSLASKGYGTRILVLAAGSLMNIVLPFLIAAIAFMIPHNVATNPNLKIEQVQTGSPAATAGIQPGDTILAIDNTDLSSYSQFQQEVKQNAGKEITLTVKHADTSIGTYQLTPRVNPPAGQGAIGIMMGYDTVRETVPVWQAFPAGATYCWDTLVAYKNVIVTWVQGSQAPQLSGIVGMTEVTGQVAKLGMSPLLLWAAFISLNLGIINILPLPALDGGRIAFVLLEMIRRGKRVSPRVEGLVHGIGFMLLIALMLLVTYSDISKLITAGSVLP